MPPTRRSVEQVEQAAEVGVHLHRAVGEVAGPADPGELGARDRRQVEHGVVEVDVEGLAGVRAAADEGLGAVEVLAVDVAARLHVEALEVAHALALAPLDDEGLRVAGRVVEGVVGPEALVVGVGNAVPLVEAVVDRVAARLGADVPLAVAGGRVAGVGEDVADGPLPGDEAALRPGQLHRAIARADRVAAGHQRRAAGGALRLGREVEQLQSLGGEGVDPRRRRAAQHASAVAAELPHAEVVDLHVKDVGATAAPMGPGVHERSPGPDGPFVPIARRSAPTAARRATVIPV